MSLFEYFLTHHREIEKLTLQHIELVGVASVLAVIVGVSVGVIISRPRLRRFAQFVFLFINIGQTVPTLAVVALAMVFLGIGFAPSVAALFLLSLIHI